MFSRIFTFEAYDLVVGSTLHYGVGGGAILGSVTGAYLYTKPEYGKVRLRDAILGSFVGGFVGGFTGACLVVGYPLFLVSPLALGPYVYNKSKMDKTPLQ